jgi:hypothetical protein
MRIGFDLRGKFLWLNYVSKASKTCISVRQKLLSAQGNISRLPQGSKAASVVLMLSNSWIFLKFQILIREG